jgi:3-methyladenine DNA glycosylase AlkD
LASLIDDPQRVTERQLERWARDFDSWAICDGVCQDLFSKTRYAWVKALEWSKRPEVYVKRASFALVAKLAVHDRRASNARFIRFLRVIERESDDSRDYVRKGVNWALREIGKRNQFLNSRAVHSAERIRLRGTSAARWVASDALRELRSEAVQRRLAARAKSP